MSSQSEGTAHRRSELGPRLVAGEDGTIELIFKHTNTGADSSLGEVEIGRCANEAASLDDFEKRPRNTNIHPAISRRRSEEHTSELQSLMRISYAVFFFTIIFFFSSFFFFSFFS